MRMQGDGGRVVAPSIERTGQGKSSPDGGAGAERGDGDAVGVERGVMRGPRGICHSEERASGSLRAPRAGAGRRRVGACERMQGTRARGVDALFNFLIGVV